MKEALAELDFVSKTLAQKMDELSIYKNLFEFSTEAQVIIDHTAFFIDVNEEFVRLIGFSKEKLLSTSFYAFMHPDDVGRTNGAYQESLKGIKHEPFTNRYMCADGKYRNFTWFTSTIKRHSIYLYSKAIITEI